MVNITTAGIPACARHFPALAQLPCQKRRMALFTLLITAPGLRQSLLPGHGSGWFPQALDLSAVSLPLYLFLSPQSAASQLRNSATPPPGVAELRSWPSLKSPEWESIHKKKQTPSGVEEIVGMRRQPIFLPVGFGFPTTIQPILG